MKTAVPKDRPFSKQSSRLPDHKEPQDLFVYHWGRIVAALFVLILVVGIIIWGAFEIVGTGEENEALADNQEVEAPPVPSVTADLLMSAEPESVPLSTAAPKEKPEPGTSAGVPDHADSVQAEVAETPVSVIETAPETASGETSEDPGTSQSASEANEPAPSVEPATLPATTAETSAPRKQEAASMEILSDHLIRAQLSTGLEEKEPIDEIANALTMDSDGLIQIYLFTEIQGMKDQRLFHDWYREGERVARVQIRPFLDPMRASSAKYIDRHMVGDWRVEVVTKDGDILAKGAFSVLPQ